MFRELERGRAISRATALAASHCDTSGRSPASRDASQSGCEIPSAATGENVAGSLKIVDTPAAALGPRRGGLLEKRGRLIRAEEGPRDGPDHQVTIEIER